MNLICGVLYVVGVFGLVFAWPGRRDWRFAAALAAVATTQLAAFLYSNS